MVEKKTLGEKTAKKKVAKAATKKTTVKKVATKRVAKPLKGKTSDRSVLKRELLAKAKKLAAKIQGVETGDLKEELSKQRELLIPLDDYVKTGIHLGTKVITPDMKPFVYRRRADSIGVLNTSLIDEYIKKAIKLISGYSPEQIILVCKREAGWEAGKLFSKATGIKMFGKKYPAGMMTNIQLEEFYEPELVIVCDSWVDRNALSEAKKTNKKIIMLCDTNNYIKNVENIIPCNNKSGKSLGLVFYLLAQEYNKKNKIKTNVPSMNTFIGDNGQEV